MKVVFFRTFSGPFLFFSSWMEFIYSSDKLMYGESAYWHSSEQYCIKGISSYWYVCVFVVFMSLMLRRFALNRNIGNLDSDLRGICEEAMWWFEPNRSWSWGMP
jgi:hypothetical protein